MKPQNNDLKCWVDDLNSFLNSTEAPPPQNITASIKIKVSSDLNPVPVFVFLRLALCTLVASSLTLLFCPQFGLGRSGLGPMSYFMQFGHGVCQFACGMLFIGFGVLASTLILSRDELRVLARTKFLQISALSALLLGMFICIGPGEFATLEIYWLLGGFMGGLISLQGGSFIRERWVLLQR